MNSITLILSAVALLWLGAILGYYARQTIAKRKYGTIEAKLQEKISKSKQESEEILKNAKEKSEQVLERAKREISQRQKEVFGAEQAILKRESVLDQKFADLEEKEKEFKENVQKLQKIKESIEDLRKEALEKLERVAGITKAEAKKELFENLEKEEKIALLEKIRKLEAEGIERFQAKAKEILALAIQKSAVSQVQEITTSTVALPSEEIKGRIIGKEGRNIRTLERLTGVELIVDETPEAVVISSFDPVRRQIAKTALEKLISDGRIQPARIEEMVEKAEKEVAAEIKKAGESAVYETGLIGLDPKLVQLLGRLYFRTSYGQNVLLHSLEVGYLAQALAQEIGADAKLALKAGLLHDIGKSIDRQVEGSHTDIGIKILEKFGAEPEVVIAMKSHHEEYPSESLEAVLVQTADAISGARPGARKDTVENYLKRLADLEKIALSFQGVGKAWALQAGREIRVFVKPEEVDDYTAQKLAKEIADRIQEELKYPGEIKVNLIREKRVVEYAK